jgi:hypothetical protein
MSRERHPTIPLPIFAGPALGEVADSYTSAHLDHVWAREDVTATNPYLRAITDEEATR